MANGRFSRGVVSAKVGSGGDTTPIPGSLILPAKPARWDPLKAHGRSGRADDDTIENPELPLSREENRIVTRPGLLQL
jgi:hypothetical protein